MQDYEKLGAFYLGRTYDMQQAKVLDETILYDAKDLTTHGICVGMTGSGKTGLCIGLLEEAAIDGIPALVIDPKGDMGNLMLTFPDLAPADFRPWVDEAEALRKGVTADALAADTARLWRDGLAQWGQQPERIARLRDAAEVAIYTPGSSAGLQVSALHSLDAPPFEIVDDAEALAEHAENAVSGLMALLGMEADPVRSREHILLSNILATAWRAGRGLDIAGLIGEIQKPPFERVGVLDVESFYPAKDRFELAMSFNNLLASPGFAAWLEGEALDVQSLLYTPEGKPRIAIMSIAHLSDPERMFFVTILLNNVLSWMRRQAGTSSLRAILYMDEIFGFFPPTAMPPCKRPMLTLLKQARAYGLGVLLATQNPVDLDYKGLANTGTWLIGRLQTERDKARLLDGLEGASAGAGQAFDRQKMDETLAGLGKRVFLMHNVHEDAPTTLHTRWALSYLCGPLTKPQIKTLMDTYRAPAPAPAASSAAAPATAATVTAPPAVAQQPAPAGPQSGLSRPVLEPGVEEFYVPVARPAPAGSRMLYRPAVIAVAQLHYASSREQVDLWRNLLLLGDAPEEGDDVYWDQARIAQVEQAGLRRESETPEPQYSEAPSPVGVAANYEKWRKSLVTYLYQNRSLTLYKCSVPKAISRPDETEGAFRGRLVHIAREARDMQVEKLRSKYSSKLASAQERVRRAQEKIERERAQYGDRKLDAGIALATGLAGALFGRKLASVTNVQRGATALRGHARAQKEKDDIKAAELELETQTQKLAELEQQFQAEVAELQAPLQPADFIIEEVPVRPRKSDITIPAFGLAWTPWAVASDGTAQPLFEG